MLDGIVEQIVKVDSIIALIAGAVIPIIPPDRKFTVGCMSDEMRRAAMQFLDQARQQMTETAIRHQVVMVVEYHPMPQFPSVVQKCLP